ncbi:MAG: dTDP-4-dehydrorhamnose reductase [Cytophagales bacterium]|nr:dTDP-4-dehydrorhamnose reductase [Armatimonadota bacterium]
MKVLVTGAAGMLGTDVCKVMASRGHLVTASARANGEGEIRPGFLPLDITDTAACREQIRALCPDAILHCAAWTNVDGAERDLEGAYRGNALGAWNVASAAAAVGAIMVYVSTDFVFDGEKGTPYTEFDRVNPLGAYGASKEAGEQLVRQTLPHRHIIARTSWLFGIHGKNFVTTIQRLAQKLPEVPVVSDQVGCPTFTPDLAGKLADLLEAPLLPGTYHISNAGHCSWFAFAQAIVKKSELKTPVVPITGAEYAEKFNSPTRRPAFSPLRPLALEMRGMNDLRPWEDALDRYLVTLADNPSR